MKRRPQQAAMRNTLSGHDIITAAPSVVRASSWQTDAADELLRLAEKRLVFGQEEGVEERLEGVARAASSTPMMIVTRSSS